MLLYCLKCRKDTKSKSLKVVKSINGRIMPLSKKKNVQCVTVKNLNLSKSKKLVDY